MSTNTNTSATAAPTSVSALSLIGRLLIASLFLVSAFGKLAAPAGTIGFIASVGLPMPVLAFALALATESIGGVLLALGYRTRLVAAILALFSVASALIFHNALGDQNQLFHFMKNLAMAGGLLQVVAFGGGAYSLDGRQFKIEGILSSAR
ncbi:DoxX family protein [Pandoraea norimbergensis]|uniref:LysR family transcriptional regulator n=1 Tax=Pandoraea norimbergensis TaxID=93219 RepID=A0ABN4JPR2_9BURK|nr:DoxX family protein [Pandoraea norimbergensis]ALS62142.1 LysR family transcriptional regulator [Pandoraea norimbergensis]